MNACSPFLLVKTSMIDTRKSMTERMCLSALKKYNKENTPYSYKSSILLEALFRASRILGNEEIFNYVNDMINYYIPEDGVVTTYKLEDYSMDQVRMGNLVIDFYKLTGQKKYKTALDLFYKQLQGQPRTPSKGFWHKKRYQNQMWLDGLYMQGPFYASYTKKFGGLKECLEDIVYQFELVYEKTLDTNTGLLRHAWDESCSQPWCDPKTGRSKEVWARALGWYVMALADLLEIIPEEDAYQGYRSRLLRLAMQLAPVVLRYQDKASGMWYQVMDKAGEGANYLESSSTCMFVYFFAKMNRLGFLDESYRKAAQVAFSGLCGHSVTVDEGGELFLHDTCKSAGLGRASDDGPYRPADFKYYTEGEPRVTDNLHGVGPFISAALELEFPAQLNGKSHVLKPGEDLNAVLKENAGKKAVVVPSGHYEVGPIDVPSHTHLIFEQGAVLDYVDDFEAYPPIHTRWEGVCCWAMHPCFLINNANDVVVEGSGTLNGHGQRWWDYIWKWKNGGRPAAPSLPIEKRLAGLNPNYLNEPGGGGGRPCQFLRPALLQILDSKNIRIDGITLVDSPFWTIHPINSTNLLFKDIVVSNPADSPNTDGIDIESCVNVEVRGCDIDVGDDGIAVKCGSGKEMMQFQRSENISACNCVVRNAHGGFVVGSETASGVKCAYVKNCRFLGTDRGIRIKTRRCRGGHMTDIVASNIYMKDVICPISINMFYRCGSDDPSLFSLKPFPVTEDTPVIKNVLIENVHAQECRNSAGFIAGLPESELQNVVFRDCSFELTDMIEENTEPEMCQGIPESSYRGIRVINADATFENVKVNVEPAVMFERF